MAINSISIVKKKFYPEIAELENNFQISDDGELCVAIGGDGTFLRAAKSFTCPILHIRGGERDSLGYHAEITISDIRLAIKKLKQGEYSIDRYPKLRIAYRNRTYNAINDAILFRAGSRGIHFTVNYYDCNGNEVPLFPGTIRGDGLIFAREIGSTAYNYFAHGPILLDIDGVVVTPISANYDFSIVSNKNFRITLTKSVAVLECDGKNISKLYRGDSFTVTKSDRVVQVVRLQEGEKFSDKLARLEGF